MFKNATMTKNIFREMIFNFWKKKFQYVDIEIFKFLNDWLIDFKNRYFIKKYFRHDEMKNVDQTQMKIELMKLR